MPQPHTYYVVRHWTSGKNENKCYTCNKWHLRYYGAVHCAGLVKAHVNAYSVAKINQEGELFTDISLIHEIPYLKEKASNRLSERTKRNEKKKNQQADEAQRRLREKMRNDRIEEIKNLSVILAAATAIIATM